MDNIDWSSYLERMLLSTTKLKVISGDLAASLITLSRDGYGNPDYFDYLNSTDKNADVYSSTYEAANRLIGYPEHGDEDICAWHKEPTGQLWIQVTYHLREYVEACLAAEYTTCDDPDHAHRLCVRRIRATQDKPPVPGLNW